MSKTRLSTQPVSSASASMIACDETTSKAASPSVSQRR
jgi:hypothetical protein